MKYFENPEIMIEKFGVEDVITTSGCENDTNEDCLIDG